MGTRVDRAGPARRPRGSPAAAGLPRPQAQKARGARTRELSARQQSHWACSEAGQVWVCGRQLMHYTRARRPGGRRRRRRSAGGREGGAASSSHDRHHQAEKEFVRRERPSFHLERLVSAFGKTEYKIKEETERRRGKSEEGEREREEKKKTRTERAGACRAPEARGRRCRAKSAAAWAGAGPLPGGGM